MQSAESLAQGVLSGNRLALARLLTLIENGASLGSDTLNRLYPRSGQAHQVGITGAPGTGKSSLVNALAWLYRHPGEGMPPRRVGILAVDPSSPFSGGAILGDRVRMKDLAGDAGVFIRSMATRGALGGLAAATAGMVLALDAAGYEVILIETVGAGQSEVDIARLAHTTLVVEAPGLGDDIQAIKAGILEIADILVINKADQPGAEITERSLRANLQLAHPLEHVFLHHREAMGMLEKEQPGDPGWLPPILKTVATDRSGCAELVQQIDRHRDYLEESGEYLRRENGRLEAEVEAILRDQALQRLYAATSPAVYQNTMAKVFDRQLSPWEAARRLLDREDA